jgi:hypothetical protein
MAAPPAAGAERYRMAAAARRMVKITALDTHHSQIAWIENSSR